MSMEYFNLVNERNNILIKNDANSIDTVDDPRIDEIDARLDELESMGIYQ